MVAKRYSVWIFFTSFCGYRSYSRQKLLHRFLSQLFVASHWGLSGGRETSLRFLAPRNKSAMKIEWETDCYSTITFFFALDPQSSSSSSHLKNASFSQCLKITLKKVSFCNIAKFIFGEKLNQINSLIKIRENIIVLHCLVVDNFDFTWKIVKIILLKNSWKDNIFALFWPLTTLISREKFPVKLLMKHFWWF